MRKKGKVLLKLGKSYCLIKDSGKHGHSEPCFRHVLKWNLSSFYAKNHFVYFTDTKDPNEWISSLEMSS